MQQPLPKRPSAIWTKSIEDPKEQENFEDILYRSATALRRLKEILEKELQAVIDADCTMKDIEESANWTLLQAARVGEKTRLKKTLQLLDFLN